MKWLTPIRIRAKDRERYKDRHTQTEHGRFLRKRDSYIQYTYNGGKIPRDYQGYCGWTNTVYMLPPLIK